MLLITGCAAFRSEMGGAYGEGEENFGADPVDVVFVFSHARQIVGYDAVPKLESQRHILRGFDDIFIDAMREISNLDGYATYTEYASDVSNPTRRAMRDSLIAQYDYTVNIRFMKKTYFSRYFLGNLFSTVSLTTFPIRYTQYYSMEAKVYDSNRRLVATYERKASLRKWVETLLIFVYPFHPEARVREEIYVDFLHDLFRQIESERILVSPAMTEPADF